MQGPERTCIGCRAVLNKHEVIRLVAGPNRVLIDYREKLPGRAAYVCPNRQCISQALGKGVLARALHAAVPAPEERAFLDELAVIIRDKIRSMVSIARKAAKTAAGYSAVHDALEKGRVKMLLFAEDLSDGTREKLDVHDDDLVQETLFTRRELGALFSRDLVGVVGILDEGIANVIGKEARRLKNLINKGN